MSIVTLTLNPSLDVSTEVDRIEPWRKMRGSSPSLYPGGGGINVARAVRALGGDARAVVALGGHIGATVRREIARSEVDAITVRVQAETRQCFLVSERSSGRQFRFILPGGAMSEHAWHRCLTATVEAAADASCVVASSSCPDGVADDAFAVLARAIEPLGIPLIIDTSGPALRHAIREHSTLVKPSLSEFDALVGRQVRSDREVERAARELLAAGRCEAIAISMAEDGLLLVPRGAPAFVVRAPAVHVVGASGAGDSMVAGFALALSRGESWEAAARLGVAAGTASVLAPGTGLCNRTDVDRLLDSIEVSVLSDPSDPPDHGSMVSAGPVSTGEGNR